MIGLLAGFGGEIPGVAMVMAALRITAIMVRSRADQEAPSSFMTARKLKPVIDSLSPLDDAAEAFSRSTAGVFGKVVIKMD